MFATVKRTDEMRVLRSTPPLHSLEYARCDRGSPAIMDPLRASLGPVPLVLGNQYREAFSEMVRDEEI